ncbi:hypothetical protein C1645_532010 [Glomus cerebriforme]|uniref:HBS1-like protein N-terminal domain-containing protein n=1 Tax=Glomus cerebriforme TaxID=658196 RepID=A0A397SGQ6_9GLOM|nr:hypothetical protein C1645_532010 [Glomus cerebriforme]
MSRHRIVRNLNAADILENYDYDYNDYDDYDDENYEMTPEDKAQMDKGKILVKNVIGQIEEISDKDIENALWNHYYNAEDTIAYLLGMLVAVDSFIELEPVGISIIIKINLFYR